MGADYTITVAIRYLLLAMLVIATHLVAPPFRARVAVVPLVAVYVLVIIHVEPAARYARRAPAPWARWTALYAARAHAFCAAAWLIASPYLTLRFQPGPAGAGEMRITNGWKWSPSLPVIAAAILAYVAVSVWLALIAGAESRDRRGAVEPERHLIRIRRRPRPGPPPV